MQGQRLDGVALTFASASIIELPQTFTVPLPALDGDELNFSLDFAIFGLGVLTSTASCPTRMAQRW